MICPNCNVTISKYSKYCPRCGILFESNDVENYSKSFNNKYMEIYFPNKEIKFHIDRVSIFYALFTSFYALYKKMYGIATISFLLQIFLFTGLYIVTSVLKEGTIAIFLPLLFIVLGIVYVYFYYVFNFDRLLIENRQYRVNKILRENEDKSEKELIQIMEKDSKGNIKGTLFVLIIVVIIIFLIFK